MCKYLILLPLTEVQFVVILFVINRLNKLAATGELNRLLIAILAIHSSREYNLKKNKKSRTTLKHEKNDLIYS